MLIRAAGDRDADSIATIYNHYVRVGGSTFDQDPWTIGQTRHLLNADEGGVWLVAANSDDSHAYGISGWASARRFSARYGYRYSLESAVYVDQRSKRQGVGWKLMEALMSLCQKRSIHYLMARIIAGNGASIDFHQRLGFEVVGTQREVGYMNDQWLDVVLLQKLL
jgi:phosphinothricin acetyltransferase